MANNIDIAIGAKDTASSVLKNIGTSAKNLETKIGSLSNVMKGLTAAMGPLLAVYAAIRASQAVVGIIGESNEAFKVQEAAARGATDSQKEYASQMQRVLGIGDEISLDLMRRAKLLGISEDQAADAATAAIGLAKASGTSTEETLKKISQAMNGNANAFGEVIPGIQNMATEQEKLAAINKLATRGLQEQKSAMQQVVKVGEDVEAGIAGQTQVIASLEGVQTRAANSWGDMLEIIGQILQPIRMVVSQGFAVFAEVMQSALAPAVDLANAAMSKMPVILDWVSRAITAAITAVEVVITNLPDVVALATATIQLYWTRLVEDAKHIWTNALPSYLTWFSDNWMALATDAVTAAATIYVNYFKRQRDLFLLGLQASLDLAEWFAGNLPTILYNAGQAVYETVSDWLAKIGQAFTTAWDYITAWWQGGGTDAANGLTEALSSITDQATKILASPPGTVAEYSRQFAEIMGRDLLEGFEATTKPLPDVISRQLTEKETALQEQIAKLGGKLGDEFSTKFGERMKAVGETFGEMTLEGNLAANKIGANIKKDKGATTLNATEGRLLTRGRADDPQALIADNTKATVKELQAINKREEQRVTKPQPQVILGVIGA